jgi:hypothetical protein
MGEFSTPALAAAVANSGGLGGLGMWRYSAIEAERRVAGFRQLSGGSLKVNYPLWENPGDLTGTGQAMRTYLQRLFDEHGLGPVPQPTVSAGEIDANHLTQFPPAPGINTVLQCRHRHREPLFRIGYRQIINLMHTYRLFAEFGGIRCLGYPFHLSPPFQFPIGNVGLHFFKPSSTNLDCPIQGCHIA